MRGNRDGTNGTRSLSRLRHRADAAMVAMVCRHLPDPRRSSPSPALHAEYHGAAKGSRGGRSQAENRPHPCAPELLEGLSNRELRDCSLAPRSPSEAPARGALCYTESWCTPLVRKPRSTTLAGASFSWPGLLFKVVSNFPG